MNKLFSYQFFFSIVLCLAFSSCLPSKKTPVKDYYLVTNQAFEDNSSQELLLNLVRLRYRDKLSFLNMSGITVQAGGNPAKLEIGSSIKTTGNAISSLDPTLTISPASEHTMTFNKLQGKEFVKDFMRPIPVEVVALFFYNNWPIDQLLTICGHHFNRFFNDSSEGIAQQKEV